MLELFGLDEDTESVYRTAIAAPEVSVPDLALRLGRPAGEIRDALDRLAKRCLMRASWNDPGVFRPVRPDIALESMVAEEQAELERWQERLDQSSAAIVSLVAEYAGPQQGPVTGEWGERIDGVDAIRERIEQLTWSAKYELLSVLDGQTRSPIGLAPDRAIDAVLIDHGIDIRLLCHESIRADQVTMEHAKWLTEHGGQVRTCAVVPPRTLVFDRTQVMLPAQPDADEPAAVLVSGRGIVMILAAFFDQLWQAAQTFGTPPPARAPELTDMQHELLRLLYQGNTDEAVARKLGASVRTVRRLAAELMQETGAHSRFQLGARAVERNWLSISLTPHARTPDAPV